MKRSSGAGPEELLLQTANPKAPQDWSKDGRVLIYVEVDPKTSPDLWTVEIAGNRTPRPVANTQFDERNAQFSPDGRWVAYQTNESGQFQIVVQGFRAKDGGMRANGRDLTFKDGKKLFVGSSGTGAPDERPEK